MKLYVENIFTGDRLFVIKEEFFPYNDFPLHVHPEYELLLVLKSSGKRYVGDHIADFYPGDLCLFGPNLPHTYYNKHLPADREVHQIVIQFREDCLGDGFFDKPPFRRIKALLERSSHGIAFSGATRSQAAQKIQDMTGMDEAEAAAAIISLLNLLSGSDSYELLSTQEKLASSIQKDTERMHRIYHYLLDNFKKEISLEEIAGIANLSPAAFCRYFKKHTRKTLSGFVNDLRISYACRLLQQGQLSVLQVCYESGFNNISYFNRQFKLQLSASPLKYQKRLQMMEEKL
ncbi:AraC family transcriptional regulator [Chitinophaga agrisoli]|uniref:AraC family transcriptional regulator n=1 Tax=Chitinophaga agrisoli TaxID=2607653 RepID=A0A5B2VHL7_9BACT|nr:AraC family transcriptional regulator [Chitinophaga agrisoli]KAA2239063.1 AraC family transcriptional regulator [Chitinophaga agrisoli]